MASSTIIAIENGIVRSMRGQAKPGTEPDATASPKGEGRARAPSPLGEGRGEGPVTRGAQFPNSAVYFFLISFTCGSIPFGSSGSSLMFLSGVRFAGSFTSG